MCPTLCDLKDCSLQGSSIHSIFQARVLEWVAISFSRGSSRPRDQTQVSRIAADALTSEPPGKPSHINMHLSHIYAPFNFLKTNRELILKVIKAKSQHLFYSSFFFLPRAYRVQFSSVAQSCPTLCDPVDCSPPGFSVYGIIHARILEWVAISFSRGSS